MILRIWIQGQPTNQFMVAETKEIFVNDALAKLHDDLHKLTNSKHQVVETGLTVQDLF